MTPKRKSIRALALAVLAVFAAGCGGFSHTHSISPASFLLPGLLKTEPPPAPSEPAQPDPTLPEFPAVQQVAQVR